MNIEGKDIRVILNPEDEYCHKPDEAQNYNESMYFNIFDPAQNIGGWFRIGNRVNEGYAEVSACVYLPDGRVGFMFNRPRIDNNDELNAGGGPRLVKGIEADILPDGRLDVPPGCEGGLEYVVASVHSSFRMTAEAQTERVLAAVRHPACRVLGHPTGRLLLARPGYEIDLERVLEACAERGVAVEINASPYRLDLDAMWARRAIELGALLAVNPDAHDAAGLADVRWGVTVARRAKAETRHLINCGDIEGWLARR